MGGGALAAENNALDDDELLQKIQQLLEDSRSSKSKKSTAKPRKSPIIEEIEDDEIYEIEEVKPQAKKRKRIGESSTQGAKTQNTKTQVVPTRNTLFMSLGLGAANAKPYDVKGAIAFNGAKGGAFSFSIGGASIITNAELNNFKVGARYFLEFGADGVLGGSVIANLGVLFRFGYFAFITDFGYGYFKQNGPTVVIDNLIYKETLTPKSAFGATVSPTLAFIGENHMLGLRFKLPLIEQKYSGLLWSAKYSATYVYLDYAYMF